MFDFKKLQKMQQEMQEKMGSIQDDLGKQRVEGSSGGGMVKAIVTGNQELVDLQIAKDAVDPDDVEMLQDLVIAAVNQAMAKAKEVSQQSYSKIMPSGTGIPGLPF